MKTDNQISINNIDAAIRTAKKMPRKSGKAEYINHLEGKRLTRSAAIKATCFECIGGEDVRPCTIINCALTQYCQWNRSKGVAAT